MIADEVVNNSSEDGRDGHPGMAGEEEQKATPKAQELGPLSASEGRLGLKVQGTRCKYGQGEGGYPAPLANPGVRWNLQLGGNGSERPLIIGATGRAEVRMGLPTSMSIHVESIHVTILTL